MNNKQQQKHYNFSYFLFLSALKNENNKPLFIGLLSVISYGALCLYSTQSSNLNVTTYFGFYAIVFALYGYMVYHVFHHKRVLSFGFIIGFSLLFHLIGIIAAPQFEDDFFRYLWDGYIFFERGNPYLHAPSAYFSDSSIPAIFQNLLNQINYPDIKTIYAPLLQYSFWLSHWLFPGDILGLKIIFSACNIILIYLLSKLTKTRNILIYAWNPLIIKEVAFTAHPDILGIVFLIAAIYFFVSKPKIAAICLGFSVCSKPFAWIIAFFILIRFNMIQWLIFILTIATLYSPFMLNGSAFAGLFAFGKQWEFNAAIYSLMAYTMPSDYVKIFCGGIFMGVMTFYFIKFKKSTVENIRGDILIGCLLILSPVINPWYLLWVLPFAAIHLSLWPWVSSFALMFSYFSGINLHSEHLQAYQLAIWVKPLEYTLIFLAIAFDFRKYKGASGN